MNTDVRIYGIEVKVRSNWGLVCHSGWNDNAAKVVCRELGYPGMTQTKTKYEY